MPQPTTRLYHTIDAAVREYCTRDNECGAEEVAAACAMVMTQALHSFPKELRQIAAASLMQTVLDTVNDEEAFITPEVPS